MAVKRILFVGLSSVGDVIMTTPVLQSLQNTYPEACFDIIADKRSIALYKNFPKLNRLYIKDKDLFLRGVPDLISRLWRYRYDVIVDVRTDGLPYLLRAKKKYTKLFAKSYGPHAVQEIMGVIADIHGNTEIPDTYFWLSDSDRQYARDKISVFDSKDKLLAISAGDPNKPYKTWTEEKYIELLNKNKNNFTGLICLGGSTEAESTDRITSMVDMPFINTTGNSLSETAALLEKSCLYIGPDSGLGHIASALKIPTISFFSVVSPDRFRPWGERSTCIIGSDNDARNITVNEVNSAVMEIMHE